MDGQERQHGRHADREVQVADQHGRHRRPRHDANQGTQQCLPPSAGSSAAAQADANTTPTLPVAVGAAHLRLRADRRAGRRDRPRRREGAGRLPGRQVPDLGHRRRLQDRRRALHRRRRHPAGRRSSMHPTRCRSTLRIQVFNDNAAGRRDLRGRRRAGPAAGFTAHLTDVLGAGEHRLLRQRAVHALPHDNANGRGRDAVFGANGKPVVDTARSTGKCVSDRTGSIVIPNLGPDRYAATVTPPRSGQPTSGSRPRRSRAATTTTSGARRATPASTPSRPRAPSRCRRCSSASSAPMTSHARGATRRPARSRASSIAGCPTSAAQNGQVVAGDRLAGANVRGPIAEPWIALSDLDHSDQQVYVGRGDADGSFDIKNVPDGTYQLTIWDDDQDYILWSFNVDGARRQTVDVGNEMLVGWFTHVHGTVFIDTNGNGKRDPGEQRRPEVHADGPRARQLADGPGQNTATTDDSGHYDISEAYPLGKWLVLEAFNTRYKTTGITYQADNEPTPTTQLGGLVDVNFLPIIGLGGRDRLGRPAVRRRRERRHRRHGHLRHDPQRARPGRRRHRGLPARHPGRAGATSTSRSLHRDRPDAVNDQCRQGYELAVGRLDRHGRTRTRTGAPSRSQRHLHVRGVGPAARLHRRGSGTARRSTDQQALPAVGHDANASCVEAPMTGVRDRPADETPATSARPSTATTASPPRRSTCTRRRPRPGAANPRRDARPAARDPLRRRPARRRTCRCARTTSSSVDIPNDPVDGKPMYKVTAEEDVNVFDGDTYLPQENFPPTSGAGDARPTRSDGRSPAAAGPAAVAAGRHHLAVRRRAAHRARHRPGLPRRRRQPVRGPGPARRARTSW